MILQHENVFHGPNVPTNNVKGEIVLLLKKCCLKLCKVSRLIKVSKQTYLSSLSRMSSIGERSGGIDGHSTTLMQFSVGWLVGWLIGC